MSASKTSEGASAAQDIEKYDIPEPEPFVSFQALKDRIRHHYEVASDYYYSLWGEHIHHGYWITPDDTKEKAQVQLIELLLQRSEFKAGSKVLDVGCGIGGTSRFLAKNYGCVVTGVTISGRQVELAKKLTLEASHEEQAPANGIMKLGDGSVQFIELDAEKMGEYFIADEKVGKFDYVWISEAMSHFPNKPLFFENAAKLLNPGGKLMVADWFKNSGLSEAEFKADISPIEDGMLLPPLCTQSDYVEMAEKAGFKIFAEPLDISKEVAKTWDLSWTLIQSPALWAFAVSQGRDGLAFFQSFRAMRRGYANGSFRYAVMVFQK
ncbi:putative tocopherol O-methyltransferase-like protein [Lachnellula hyalina]|uniref:Putative tocopherol O-methyltransferase-like protein n=1 Tax=Lachnellula hyalina TaxID=1316788 RepID=A0A8H8R899_9HELO|nr:putative tocopherol O-methyltransferase-like protein [Lachnellula hyalina]TVY29437.1 putative tocopherol O-methyltransferase-like protein [Lachnellula hyalina]